MTTSAERAADGGGVLAAALPWLALAIGFSPVLAELPRNLRESPEDASFLLPVFLLALALHAVRRRPRAPAHRDGLVAVAAGAALQVLGVATGSWSLARLGLPLAALGLGRLRGHPPAAVLALGFFAVPIPDSLVALASPELEGALARAASALLRGVGLEIEAVGFSLVAEAGRVNLEPSDGGLPLAAVLASLGWYGVARRGGRSLEALPRAVGWALLAPPLALAAVALAGALATAGASHAARLWLMQGVWLTTGVLGLALLGSMPTPSWNAAPDGSAVRR